MYLMSNTHPKRGGPVYAKGYGPGVHVPGDDYVELVELGAVDGIQPSEQWVTITVTSKHFIVRRESPARA